MKKIVLALLVSVYTTMAFSSISTNANTPSANITKSSITGNWSLSNITFENISEGNVKAFLGEPSYKCFIGSIWNLTSSGNGEYLLPNNDMCAAKAQNIFWSYNATDAIFEYKPLKDGEKPKNVKESYKLLLASNNGSEMTIKYPIIYNGGTAYVRLHFQKIG